MDLTELEEKIKNRENTRTEAVFYNAVRDKRGTALNFTDVYFINAGELDELLRTYKVVQFTVTAETSNMLKDWYELQERGWKIDGMQMVGFALPAWAIGGENLAKPGLVFKQVK